MADAVNITPEKQQETHTEPKKEHGAAHKLAHAIDAPSIASSTSDISEELTKDGKEPFKTAGEKVHKWGTYLGVDWIFNAAAGVAFAYWGKYTKTGQKIFSGPVKHGFETMLKPIIKDPKSLKSSVEYGNMFVSIITGGMFTIPPLMVLENNKVKKSITQTIDGMVYGKDAIENDPRFKEAYERIENAPKKDFLTGMSSRFVALSPLLASVLFPPTRNLLDKHYFSHITKASTSLSTKMGLGAEKLFPKLSKAQALERNAFIHDNFALDFGFGVPYAILHSVFYNKFAGDQKEGAAETPVEKPAEAVKAEAPAERKWSEGMERKAMPSSIAAAQQARFTERVETSAGAERQLI